MVGSEQNEGSEYKIGDNIMHNNETRRIHMAAAAKGLRLRTVDAHAERTLCCRTAARRNDRDGTRTGGNIFGCPRSGARRQTPRGRDRPLVARVRTARVRRFGNVCRPLYTTESCRRPFPPRNEKYHHLPTEWFVRVTRRRLFEFVHKSSQQHRSVVFGDVSIKIKLSH